MNRFDRMLDLLRGEICYLYAENPAKARDLAAASAVFMAVLPTFAAIITWNSLDYWSPWMVAALWLIVMTLSASAGIVTQSVIHGRMWHLIHHQPSARRRIWLYGLLTG